jgi:hypothetical protein
MKRALPLLSRRTLFKRGIAMLGFAISWHLLPRRKEAVVQAEVLARPYGAGSYGSGAYGSSFKVYVPIITK